MTDMYTTHYMGWDRHYQQFDTTPTLINAPQWSHSSCNAPMRLYTVVKSHLWKQTWLCIATQSLSPGCIEWCCPLSRWQICTQPTRLVKTDIVSSLTPHQLWLVHPSGLTCPVMHQCGFTRSVKSCLRKHTWLCIATQLMFLDSAWMYH